MEKSVRRKASFIRHLDSSEEVPSSHDSLFDAEYLSNSEDGNLKHGHIKAAVVDIRHPLPLSDIVNLGPPPNIFGETAVVYGQGTALSTISEQNSKSTMRSASRSTNHHSIPRPQSAPDLAIAISSSHPHLISKDEAAASMMSQIAPGDRRALSLSAEANHLSLLSSYHTIISSTNRVSTPHNMRHSYAHPLSPVTSPICRMATPPGVPSWTTAQQSRRPASNETPRLAKFQRLLRFSDQRLSSFERRAAAFYASLSPNISAATSQGGSTSVQTYSRRDTAGTNTSAARLAPRFRPVRSGHGPNALEMHPFARALEGTTIYDTSASSEPKPDMLLQPGRMERIANPPSSLQGRRIFTEIPRLVPKGKQPLQYRRSLPIFLETQADEPGCNRYERSTSVVAGSCPHGRRIDQKALRYDTDTNTGDEIESRAGTPLATPGPHDGSHGSLYVSPRKSSAKHRLTHSALVPLLTPSNDGPTDHLSIMDTAQRQTLCLPHAPACTTPALSPFAAGGLEPGTSSTATPVSSLRLQDTAIPVPIAAISSSTLGGRDAVNTQEQEQVGAGVYPIPHRLPRAVSNDPSIEHDTGGRIQLVRARARARDCWRCRAAEMTDAVLAQWERCMDVCCFVCCGYDDDEKGRRGRARGHCGV